MRRDALKEVELVRFSRLATRVSCTAAHITVVAVPWAHQNCHGSPHSDPGSPCTKGRAIDVRGHHAAVRRSRDVALSSIDRVAARPLAAKPLVQPCSWHIMGTQTTSCRLSPARSGRERPASGLSLMAVRPHSGRDDGECLRCLPRDNESEPLLKLLV